MKRVHRLEFEDLAWFPVWIRACMTNVLVVLMRVIGANDVLAHQIKLALEHSGETDIVDLGSGSGGAMPAVLSALNTGSEQKYSLVMTDFYPNPSIAARFNRSGIEGLRYHEQSVDATSIATAPKGLKTMINCFHHMRVDQARKILKSAMDTKQPLFIFELAENKMPGFLWWLTLPLSLPLTALTCMLFTPLVRPMTWQQIVFTYFLPIIPFFYAWDGQASMVRIYTFDDIKELLEGIEDDMYVWEMGAAQSAAGKKVGIYISGRAKKAGERAGGL